MPDMLNDRGSLDRYVAEISKYPLLTRDEEYALAVTYQEQQDAHSAHRLMVANLRFVVKTAHEYRGYGMPLLDLVQEGNVGLLIAVKKFDPSRGYCLVSYAVWWIRAYMQNFIMRTWSLVKVGTTQAQRKLFFRLRSERERADRQLGPGERAAAASIAAHLGVREDEVSSMEVRLGERDFSLDAQVIEGGRQFHVDMLATGAEDQESTTQSQQMRQRLRQKISELMSYLNAKEKYVIENRILREEPPTLQDIGGTLSISRERVRQIEGNIIGKLRAAMVDKEATVAA